MYQYVTSSMYGHATCSGHLLCQTQHSMLFTLTIMTQASTLAIRYNFLITDMVVCKVTTGAQTVKGRVSDSVGSDKDNRGVSCLQSGRGTSSLKRGWYSWETMKWVHLA
jgi:hypothetical protein